MSLLTSITGRVQSVTHSQPTISAPGGSTATYNVFDSQAGFMYNFQSALMIVYPLLDLTGVLLAVLTYNKFDTSLFDIDDHEWGHHSGLGGVNPYGSVLGSGYGSTPGHGGGGGGGGRSNTV